MRYVRLQSVHYLITLVYTTQVRSYSLASYDYTLRNHVFKSFCTKFMYNMLMIYLKIPTAFFLLL